MHDIFRDFYMVRSYLPMRRARVHMERVDVAEVPPSSGCGVSSPQLVITADRLRLERFVVGSRQS